MDELQNHSDQDILMEENIENHNSKDNISTDTIRSLIINHKGFASITNQLLRDFEKGLGHNSRSILINVIKETVGEEFNDELLEEIIDTKGASIENNLNQDLEKDQEKLENLIENKEIREMVYELSEKFPKSDLLSKLSLVISEKGYQQETNSINSASLHADVFFEMLGKSIEKIKSSDDGDISSEIDHLWKLVGYREHTYFLAQYLLQEACLKAGENGYPIQRVIEELEGRVYKHFERPLVATHIQILLEGLPVDGKDPIYLALVSMLQGGRAAPGDVVALYKAYHDSEIPPPAKIIRNTDVTELLLKEVFSFYNVDEEGKTLPENLEEKYLWLIAYAALTIDESSVNSELLANDTGIQKSISISVEKKKEIDELVKTLKQIRLKLVSITTSLDFNKMINWLLEITK
ncbi:hypothetical protein BB558_002627 [Smittium angustum]|uniref:Uncharacterized protein n=1 Tax=Smittium angustum TaxID=133377 RepID=A0A2U1J852_SMIAN|nr:hypothetical protein BB558_002627 [Smittium angustum]